MKCASSISRPITLIAIFIFTLLQITACNGISSDSTITANPVTPSGINTLLLTPYHTPTASQTPLPPDPATNTPFPTPTATPRSHIVQQGEDMYGIAFQYGITLQELQSANPDVDPNFLSVNMELLIPASSQKDQTSGVLPSPTPAGALPGNTECYQTGEGGLWCFTAITNGSENYIEGVSLQVRLGSNGVQQSVGSALSIINLIPPGVTIPAAIYFAPPIPDQYDINVLLETSLLVQNMSERYISVSIEDLNTTIADDGKSAYVEGKAVVEKKKPSRLKVAVVAYNVEGKVIGFRCYENEDPAKSQQFSMEIYSLAGTIDKVSVFTEAIR